ncbi:SH3 domain-containing protein [Hoeflea sp. BAL378]|uniref:SH3 domain-containing protein n=1 Tax=Hoeflea sp. BAL378 TaxID=1547437 RepID=UPI0006911FD6|nr:SH3 domain-containing protein [Hoeflea sp. BAL378]
MIEIESGDVIQMRDESFGELLDEINQKSGQLRMSAMFCWTGIIIGSVAGFASGSVGLILILLAFPGFVIGRWLDSYRRSTVLYYDLEGDAEEAYKRLIQGFDSLLSCAGKWHIEAGGAVTNLTAWKRNAGASHLVKKNATNLSYLLPSVIKSNVTPPALGVGKQTLFFMPDIVLIQDGAKFGAVPYGELTLRWQDSYFIEDGRVPSDARVVDHTWKHPNKSGGPDKRFRDNRQIPICLYESIHFQSKNGINELVEFSQTGNASVFADGCNRLAGLPKAQSVRSLTSGHQVEPVTVPREPRAPAKRRPLRTFMYIVLAIVVGLPVLGALLPQPAVEKDTPAVKEDRNSAVAMKPPAATEIAPNASEQLIPSATLPSQHASVSPPESKGTDLTDASAPPTGAAPLINETSPLDASTEGKGTLASETKRYARTAVNLREGPSTKNRILMTVREGASVKILGQNGNWSHVEVGAGKTGWISSEFLKK